MSMLSANASAECTPQQAWEAILKLFSTATWSDIPKYVVGGTAAFLFNYYKGAPEVLQGAVGALAAFVVLDTVTGIARAYVRHQDDMSSYRFGRGLFKVAGYLCVGAVASILDTWWNSNYMATTIVLAMAAAREGISVLENIKSLWEHYSDSPWPFAFVERWLADYSKRVAESVAKSPARTAADLDPEKDV